MNDQPLNDQPLNDTELDNRIRSMIASAVADTPAPHPLPARQDADVRALTKQRSRRGLVLAGLGVAASLVVAGMVLSSNDDNDRVVPATTVSAPTTEGAPPTTVPSTTVRSTDPEPERVESTGVRALVTQRDAAVNDGVWVLGADSFELVIPDATGPAFTVGDSIVYSPVAGGISMRAADGTTTQLRLTGFVQDAALFGGELFYLYTDSPFGESINLYLHGPGGETYIAVDDWQDTGHTSWHLGRDAIVGTGAYYAGMAANIFDHAGNRLVAEEEATRPVNNDGNPGTNDRAVYSLSPTGLWGALIGDTLTLREWGDLDAIETLVIPDWAKVSRFDVEPDRLLVTYTLDDGYTLGTSRMAVKTNGEWVWEDVPGNGVATLPRTTDPGAPMPTSTTPAAPDPWVALAGDFGVRLIEGQTSTAVDTASADRVLLLRNGSVVYRETESGQYPYLWDRSTGQSGELWAGTNWVAEPTLQDSTSDLAGDFLFTVGALLFAYQPELRRELAASPSSRLSYASNGWIVGERMRYSIGDSQPPDWIGGDGLWALSPNGGLVASYVDGVVQVRRVSDGFVVYERAATGVDVTEIDVNDEWLSIAETPDDTPNSDSTSRLVLVHVASGRMHVYEGAVSASLPDTGL